MKLEHAVEKFKNNLERRHAYTHALTILNYDAETVMPRAGSAGYGATVGLLAQENYRLLVNDDMRALLDKLLAHREELPLYLYREAEELRETIRRLEVIPIEEYGEFEAAIARAGSAWREAKQTSNFALFSPHLTRLLDYSARFAGYYDSARPLYDVLLEEYEKGLTIDILDRFFAEIKAKLVPLIREVAAAPQVDDSFLAGEFPVDKQARLAGYLLRVMRIDRDRCTLGQSEHPFTTSVSNRDVRVTTHYKESDLLASMYSVIHEGGHALYTLHTADELNATSLGEGAGLGVHESQSHFFENQVGQSAEFLGYLLSYLRELFPEQLDGVNARQFYLACNKSAPSLIRTEADELTYPLHVLIRYELEKQLVAGALQVADLPAAWNSLYKEYLGLDVPDDARGVLQDMHWSSASFGYFPTYAIGCAYAAQLYAAMLRDLDLPALLAQGELAPINAWLSERVWRYGGVKKPLELIRDACGEPFNPAYYTDYLSAKYRQIYGLSGS